MEEQRAKHSKELMKKDSEREIVSEELDSLTEQYQQLESAFESQSSQLSHSHSELEQLRQHLEVKITELDKLTQQDKQRRASLSRVRLLQLLSDDYLNRFFNYRDHQRGTYSRPCRQRTRR